MKTILDYADLVKEQHALNTTIAPVETDLTSASQAYAVGQKFIYDGVLYQAKTAIAQGAALVLNTNYEAADDVSTEIEALTNKLNNEIATRAMLSAHNLFGVGNSLDEWFAATNDGKLPTSYLASETITGTVDKDTNSIVITAYNNTGYRWGCKKINLKKNTSYTFSRTSCDGTIQLFGKNNADDRAVVISGLSNGGTVNSGDYDWWYVGFYPTRSGGYFSITDLLVNLETDADTTFQPYAKTNQELTAENQTLTNELDDEIETRVKLGAHNLARPYTGYALGTNNNNPNITPEASGIIIVAEIEPNESYIIIKDSSYGDRFRIAGFNTISFTDTSVTGFDIANIPYENEYNFTNTQGYKYLVVCVNAYSSVTLDQIKPIIRLATDTDDTYVPYAMTNRELTEKLTEALDSVTLLSNSTLTDNNRDFTLAGIDDCKRISIAGYVGADEGGKRFCITVDFNSLKIINSTACVALISSNAVNESIRVDCWAKGNNVLNIALRGFNGTAISTTAFIKSIIGYKH